MARSGLDLSELELSKVTEFCENCNFSMRFNKNLRFVFLSFFGRNISFKRTVYHLVN
jgi:hypothetical protein